MNKNRKYILIAIIASLLLTVSIGFSMWIILSEQVRGSIQSMGTISFAPTLTSSTATYYAGEDVPLSNTTVTYSYTYNGEPKEWTIEGTVEINTLSGHSGSLGENGALTAGCGITFTPTSSFAKWVWGDTLKATVSVNLLPVAKYGDDYYTTIDAALAAANKANSGTVYAIPSGDYTNIENPETGRARLAKTITVDSINDGVTLRLSNGVTAAVEETITIQPSSTNTETYNFTRVDDGKKDGLFLIYSQFSGVPTHSDAYFRTDWCENIVTVKSGVLLTNNGTITIDAVVTGAAGGAPYSSIVFGNYSKITMQSGAKITNTGTINCYGFIDEAVPDYDYTDNATITDATVQLDMQSGTLNTVFTISEHRGGNVYMGMVEPTTETLSSHINLGINSPPDIKHIYSPTLRTFAFHRFYIQSVSVNTKVSNSALMSGEVSLYANGGPNQASIAFLGRADSGPMFGVSTSDSYATFKYTHNQDATKRKMDLDVYGDAAIQPLSLKLTVEATKELAGQKAYAVIVIDLKTQGTFLPISHYLDISFNKNGSVAASVDMSQQEIKILPGGSVTIGDGVTVTADRIAVYFDNHLLNGWKEEIGATNPPISGEFSSYGIAQGLEYPDLEAGKLIVKGTLNVSSLGGPVIAGAEQAVLNITTSRSVISPELLQTYDASVTVEVTLVVTFTQTQNYAASYFSTDADSTLLATGDLWLTGATKTTGATLSTGQYVAKDGAWASPSNITVSFESNGGSTIDTQTYTTNTHDGLTLADLPTPTREYYEFSGWFMDSSLQTSANGSVVHTNTKLYAKWTPLSYTLEYVYILPDGTSVDSSIEALSFTIETQTISLISGSSLTAPEGTNYRFSGWYTAPSEGTQITAINVAEYVALADTNDGTVTIYAIWTEGSVYDIDYVVSGSAPSTLYPLPSNTTVKIIEGETTTLTPPTALDSGVAFDTIKTDPTRQYFFSGWYLDEAHLIAYQDWDQLLAYGAPAEGDTESYQRILYGSWVAKDICITYDNDATPEGATGMVDAHWVMSGEATVTLPKLTLDGYTFYGWYDSNGALVGTGDASFTAETSVTLSAKWFKHTKVTYHHLDNDICDLGSESNVTEEIYDGVTGVILPTPTKKGHTFQGWYTAASGGTKVGDAGASYTPSADITLYAQWKKTEYTITVSTSNATVNEVTNGQSACYGDTITFTVTYSQEGDRTTTVKDANGNTVTTTGSYTFTMPASHVTISASSSSCIAAGTLITLADGTQKKVEDLTLDDLLLVFNHETGRYEAAGIIFIEDDGWDYYDVINLVFSDGTATKLIYEHALFDLTLNKYVYITDQNYADFVGHEFAIQDGDTVGIVTLTEAFVEREYTGCYSLVTTYHLNYFIDGLFSIPGGIDGLFNIFEYGDGLKYDEEKMNADIEEFGLFTYEEFAQYYPEIPEEVYEMFPAKYFKVAIGKGMLTSEDILSYIEQFLIKNGII